MSDIMRPIPFARLMTWALEEYRAFGSIFGVTKLIRRTGSPALPLFGAELEAPFGPAAGPHTQLAQNIVAAYAAGARFFELKTVQILDGEALSRCVSKPCIAAGDECYNCEWSTELTVPQAYEEYVKAWFACKLLAKELGLGSPDGFLFNMSVGYDLAGIQSEKIDRFIEGLKDASGTEAWTACMEWTLSHLDLFRDVDEAYVRGISPNISCSITESTLHGCPPDEIERIAAYLMERKGLHTYVKCNPTLLGYDYARETLDGLGFGYVQFDDRHFREDLQQEDALPMFRRLRALAERCGLDFGVKLTNTFPVDVKAGELPSEEMYMSGRALLPLSLTVASRLSHAFGGALRISYSGGADVFSVSELFTAGIWPITMATTVLKPGGYERFPQISEALSQLPASPWTGVDTAALDRLLEQVLTGSRYRKAVKPVPSRKLSRQVPLVDCFTAPCRAGCPIEQDIPAYMRLVGHGDYEEALRVIIQRNSLPFITGTICPHRCQDKCMRAGVEESVHIRAIKLQAAENGFDGLLPQLKPGPSVPGVKVAVVGGGPAGLAAAYYLGRAGSDVTILERRDAPGGIVRHVIPDFRIGSVAVERDVALVKAMGVKLMLNTEAESIQSLFDQGFTHVILAVGAWKNGALNLQYGQAMNVISFLEACKKHPESLELGKHVAVIGGGNTAMDAARAAKRLPGVETVSLVYRRTRRYMPADEEELSLALADGVVFQELLSPIGVRDGILTCAVMELGTTDEAGRRAPVDTGRTVQLPADTVIAAVGELVDGDFFAASGIRLDLRGRPAVNPDTLETNIKRVYAVGDCQTGPRTVVEAMAGAAKAAGAILDIETGKYVGENRRPENYQKLLDRRGKLCADCSSCTETRCLGCATVCETCTTVCPNRANVAVWVPGMEIRQIIHVDGMCNECGNCAVFCPYESRPYRDKFTLFWSAEDFAHSENAGFLPLGGTRYRIRLDHTVKEYDISDPNSGLFEDLRRIILAVVQTYPYLLA